eukprot:8221311-Pyramimonas_sp.AAC.1
MSGSGNRAIPLRREGAEAPKCKHLEPKWPRRAGGAGKGKGEEGGGPEKGRGTGGTKISSSSEARHAGARREDPQDRTQIAHASKFGRRAVSFRPHDLDEPFFPM